ncbi:hypothetical protein ColLi_01095 [Colletotrichum liriopes]|uniref:Uncharacterized protein n=1 Tax=Colletotrichum liriopes TaxID=708192 RepID=A0AA37GCY0_9PEZI|nr:hypothetical protein ColLi_01095 [Colletotrichum liriopes]
MACRTSAQRTTPSGQAARVGVDRSRGNIFISGSAGYDAITDLPSWLFKEIVSTFPDAKFVLTERDHEAWRNSIAKTLQPLDALLSSLMIRFVGLVDSYTHYLSSLSGNFCYVLYGGYFGPVNEKAQVEALKVYLLVVRLEDGLGWEKICSVLGHDVPDVPYPRANEAAEFQKMVMGDMSASWKRTVLNAASVLVPVVGASVWFWGPK